MKKVKAIIERAGDGNYSVYMDADDVSYLVTGTGASVEEALQCFQNGYEDMKKYYEKKGKAFEELEFEYEYDMASFLSFYSKNFSLASIKDNSVTMLLDIAVHHVPLSSKCRTLFTSLLQNSATFNLYNNKSSKWLTRRRASDSRSPTSRNNVLQRIVLILNKKHN